MKQENTSFEALQKTILSIYVDALLLVSWPKK